MQVQNKNQSIRMEEKTIENRSNGLTFFVFTKNIFLSTVEVRVSLIILAVRYYDRA